MPAKAKKKGGGSFWSRTKARLVKKLGPLPVWAWLAVAAAVVIWYLRRSSTSSPATATTPADTSATDTAGTDTSGTDTSGDSGYVGGDGGYGGGVPSGGGVVGGGGPVDQGVPSVVGSGGDTVPVAPAASTDPGMVAPGAATPPGAPATRGQAGWKQIATTRTGAAIYQTPSGSIVEEAKGKSPYTVAKAGSAAAKGILGRVRGAGKPLTQPRSKAKAVPARHTAAKAAPKPQPVRPQVKRRYYTYKREVPAGKGTLHFTRGRGYYRA